MMASVPSNKEYLIRCIVLLTLITNSIVCLDNGSQINMMKYKEKEI
jgi:hypothetical protein